MSFQLPVTRPLAAPAFHLTQDLSLPEALTGVVSLVVSMKYNLCRWAFREIPPLYPPPGFPLFLPCCFLLTSAHTPDMQPIRRVHSYYLHSGHTTQTHLSLPAPTRFFPQSGTQLTYQETLQALSSDLWQLLQSPPGARPPSSLPGTVTAASAGSSCVCTVPTHIHSQKVARGPHQGHVSPMENLPYFVSLRITDESYKRRGLCYSSGLVSSPLTSSLTPQTGLQGPQDTRRTHEVVGALPSGGRVTAFHGGFAHESPQPFPPWPCPWTWGKEALFTAVLICCLPSLPRVSVL